MLARKCDRCGRLYEHYETYRKTEEKFNAIIPADIDIKNTYFTRKLRDLCPECRESFINWLEMKETNNAEQHEVTER